MSETPEMDAPVTRREMHQALNTWSGAIISNVIEKMTMKMDAMFAARDHRLEARFALTEQRLTAMIAASEQRLSAAMVRMEERLMGVLGQATRASTEELTTRVRVVDEQYKDLPARVTRLEAKVFASPKRKRRSPTRSR